MTNREGLYFLTQTRDLSFKGMLFFFSENSALNISSPAIISIQIENSKNPHIVDINTRKLSDSSLVEWSYFSGGSWKAFDRFEADTGKIVLYKNNSDRILRCSDEAVQMPIRCSSKNISALKEIAVDGIKVASAWNYQLGQMITPDDIHTDMESD